jgi:hypothetical protein
VECELTREFGVEWVPRPDGRGNEIKGITQAQMDAYSTRTVHVHEKERELAQSWERRNGRTPNSRELYFIANKATLQSRKGKDAGEIDWDALAQWWDATIGGELAGIAPTVSNASGPGSGAPGASDGAEPGCPPSRETQERGAKGAGAGVGQAPGLDPSRPAQTGGAGDAHRDPAHGRGSRAGTAARPDR